MAEEEDEVGKIYDKKRSRGIVSQINFTPQPLASIKQGLAFYQG